MTPLERKQKWEAYLAERTGTYEYRTRRYAAVADQLEHLGLAPQDLIVDVGAGMCEFDRYLRTTRSFDGRYLPVDGAIDGTDLNAWYPRCPAEFFVLIETIEHLYSVTAVLGLLKANATKGIVLTTPNPEVVDVLALDETHVSPCTREYFQLGGFQVQEVQLFNHPRDTLVATWRAPSTR